MLKILQKMNTEKLALLASLILWTEKDKIFMLNPAICWVLNMTRGFLTCSIFLEDKDDFLKSWLCQPLKCQWMLTWSIYWFRPQFYLHLNVKVTIILLPTLWAVHFHSWLSNLAIRKCKFSMLCGIITIF